MKPTDFFKSNTAASSVIKVGDRLFLSAYEKKAARVARMTGNKLEVIKRPKHMPVRQTGEVKATDTSTSNSKTKKDEK
jgi:hypothetical protein